MKPPHIILALFVITLVVYLALLQNSDPNQSGIYLPFLRARLQTGWVLAFLITFSWLIGWIPGKIALWRKGKEIRTLNKKIQDLEQHVPSYDQDILGDKPVIPDRNQSTPIPATPPIKDET